jgi:hypothetical protein
LTDNRILKQSSTIRRFFAAYFLLLFSLCITPKRILHDLLANHKDVQTAANLPFQQFATSGFHCHVDDLVVVEPFLPGIQSGGTLVLSSGPVYYAEPVCSFVSLFITPAYGRGPPAAFCS